MRLSGWSVFCGALLMVTIVKGDTTLEDIVTGHEKCNNGYSYINKACVMAVKMEIQNPDSPLNLRKNLCKANQSTLVLPKSIEELSISQYKGSDNETPLSPLCQSHKTEENCTLACKQSKGCKSGFTSVRGKCFMFVVDNGTLRSEAERSQNCSTLGLTYITRQASSTLMIGLAFKWASLPGIWNTKSNSMCYSNEKRGCTFACEEKFQCRPGFTIINSECYKFVKTGFKTMTTDLTKRQQHCAAQKGQLIGIRTPEEISLINDIKSADDMLWNLVETNDKCVTKNETDCTFLCRYKKDNQECLPGFLSHKNNCLKLEQDNFWQNNRKEFCGRYRATLVDRATDDIIDRFMNKFSKRKPTNKDKVRACMKNPNADKCRDLFVCKTSNRGDKSIGGWKRIDNFWYRIMQPRFNKKQVCKKYSSNVTLYEVPIIKDKIQSAKDQVNDIMRYPIERCQDSLAATESGCTFLCKGEKVVPDTR